MSNGTYLRYADRRFGAEATRDLGRANSVIDSHRAQGLTLTLRQLYYQFVARGWVPNTERSYKRLGDLISEGRLAGLVDWEAIEDRTRYLRGVRTYESPADVLASARAGYRRDLWADQPWRPEVWIEKNALVGVVDGICTELRVDFFACVGYTSQSEQWRAGRRMAGYVRRGQRPIVFHLGDHDPSGLDMTRDNRERLSMFAGAPVQVVRLALNMNQVEELKPPPNPTKMTDARAPAYVAEHGEECWELDALPPAALRDLVRDAVLRVRDEALWSAALAEEAAELDELDRVIEGFGGRS